MSATFLRDRATWRMRHHHSINHRGFETPILPPTNQYVNITVNNFNISVASNGKEKVTDIALQIHYYLILKIYFYEFFCFGFFLR